MRSSRAGKIPLSVRIKRLDEFPVSRGGACSFELTILNKCPPQGHRLGWRVITRQSWDKFVSITFLSLLSRWLYFYPKLKLPTGLTKHISGIFIQPPVVFLFPYSKPSPNVSPLSYGTKSFKYKANRLTLS